VARVDAMEERRDPARHGRDRRIAAECDATCRPREGDPTRLAGAEVKAQTRRRRQKVRSRSEDPGPPGRESVSGRDGFATDHRREELSNYGE